MKYSLVWSKKAEDAMIVAWLEASPEQRAAISVSTHTAEAELVTRPNDVGESRSDGRRMVICLPVALTYQILADDMLVRIEAFRLVKRRVT